MNGGQIDSRWLAMFPALRCGINEPSPPLLWQCASIAALMFATC